MKRLLIALALALATSCLCLAGCKHDLPQSAAAPQSVAVESDAAAENSAPESDAWADAALLASVPDFRGVPFAELNGGNPTFTDEEIARAERGSFEQYAPLDDLRRCGTAYACIGLDLMPTGARGDIWQIKPTGWRTSEYPFIEGEKLYNRSHLIAFMLAGENANERNLITGTRYMNATGMLPFEEKVARYVETTGNHVLYRVNPVFADDELVARGVVMEARSIEDDGAAVSFNVFCYNVQPGVDIDYATGDNSESARVIDASASDDVAEYVVNANSRKFHRPTCSACEDIAPGNREDFTGRRSELIERGYAPCGMCKP